MVIAATTHTSPAVDALVIGGFFLLAALAMALRSSFSRGLGDRSEGGDVEAASSSNLTRITDGLRQGEYERSRGYGWISKGFLVAALVTFLIAGVLAVA